MRSRWLGFLALFAIACGGTTLPAGGDVADGGTSSSDSGTTSNTCKAACLSDEVDWAANGGLTTVTQSSRVSSCTTYTHEESSTESGDLTCTDTLSDACSSSTLGAGDLYAAMQSSDVVDAFAHADGSTVLGSDSRPCDGAVLQVTYQGKSILIGTDCGNGCIRGAACTPIPTGVKALATTLRSLDQQELKTPSCESVFPGG